MAPSDHLKATVGDLANTVHAHPALAEGVLEAALLLQGFFEERGLRDKVDLTVYTPEPQPMPVAGPELGASVSGMLEKRGIRYLPKWTIREVDPVRRSLHFENGEETPFDLLVAVPPHQSPAVVRESGLAGETGWVPVDSQTLQTSHENVFALGDVTGIKLVNGMMLPKAGVFAHNQATAIAHNIAAAIKGTPQKQRFSGDGFCFIEMGHGAAAFATGNFYADPKPALQLRTPGRLWHWGKVAFEKWWLRHWF